MGAEMHAGTPDQLEWLMKFRPSNLPVILHLPRNFLLTEEQSRRRICDFATRFAGRIFGMVIHDHAAMAYQAQDHIAAARKLHSQFQTISQCPMLFVEYAVGLELEAFARFFSEIQQLDHISACIDIGHVGIREARAAYARSHEGEELTDLKSQSFRLPPLMADLEAAVCSGAAAAMGLVEQLAALNKPVHFHLHDGHPLSNFSPFGVSDHLSFLTEIPLNFEHRGCRAAAPMFGPAGLANLVARAVKLLGPRNSSFTLEIHPTFEQRALGDAETLFAHWTDKTNAERMHHWLWVLHQNHHLLRQAILSASPPSAGLVAAELDSKPHVL